MPLSHCSPDKNQIRFHTKRTIYGCPVGNWVGQYPGTPVSFVFSGSGTAHTGMPMWKPHNERLPRRWSRISPIIQAALEDARVCPKQRSYGACNATQ